MKSRYLKKRCIKGGKKRKPKSKNFNSDTNKDNYGKRGFCNTEKGLQLEKSFAKDRETETAREAGRPRGYN